MKALPLLLLLGACQAPPAAWNAPSQDGPVLCGTVTDPQGRPLAGIEVRPHGGFGTRFPGEPVRTDALGHYRIHPVVGSLMGNENGAWDLYLGVCVGSISSGHNPAEFLPWKDVRVPQEAGAVVVLDFVFDPESVPAAVRGD